MLTTEIADNFINGNLARIKEVCKNKPERIGTTYKFFKEIGNQKQAEHFMDWVATW